MRKNVEQITRTITEEKITYVAADGWVFKSEEECKKYEETSKCAISAAFESIVKKSCCGEAILNIGAPFAYEGNMRAVNIRSANDLEIVNKWILSVTGGDTNQCLATYVIGSTVILEEYEGYVYNNGTIEEMVETFRKAVEKYLGEKIEE